MRKIYHNEDLCVAATIGWVLNNFKLFAFYTALAIGILP